MKQKLPKICLIIGLIFGGLAVMNGADLLSQALRTRVYAATGQKIVTIYDKQRKQTVLTEQKTVAEVLKQAGITLDKFDLVEPSLDTEVSDGFNVNIFRARPLTVIDGERQIKILTPYQLASDIARVAGLALYPEDQVEFQLDTLGLSSGLGSQMVIRRATEFNLIFFGKKSVVRSHQATVGDFLKQRQLTLGANDRMNLGATEPLRAGMTLEIWQEGEQERTVDEEVKFTTRRVADFEKPLEFKQIKQQGKPGKRIVTYKINIKNGQEVSKIETHSLVTQSAVEQIEVVGAKIAPIAYTGGGTKDQWLSASNIPQDQWGYAEWLVQRESGWNPNSRNRSSGAYGLAQCLNKPSNSLCYSNNPVDQLNWMHGYVMGRYGSWEKAVQHSKSRGWY